MKSKGKAQLDLFNNFVFTWIHSLLFQSHLQIYLRLLHLGASNIHAVVAKKAIGSVVGCSLQYRFGGGWEPKWLCMT